MNLNTIIKRNRLGLLIVSLCLIIGIFLLNSLVSKQQIYGELINKAGKLRMLSQKITLHSTLYATTNDEKQKQRLTIAHKEFIEKRARVIEISNMPSISIDNSKLISNVLSDFLFHTENYISHNNTASYKHIQLNFEAVLEKLDLFVSVCEESQKNQINTTLVYLLFIGIFMLIACVIYYFTIFSPSIMASQLYIELLENEKRKIQNIVDNMGSIVFVKDPQGKYIFANKAFKLFFNIEFDILGKTDSQIFSDALAHTFLYEDQEVLRSQRSKVVEHQVALNNLEYTFYTTKFPLKNEHGEILGVCGIAVDITTKKQLETELKKYKNSLLKAQEIAQIGSFEFDIKTQYFSLSDQCVKILGLAPTEPYISFDNCKKIVHSKDLYLVKQQFENASKTITKDSFQFRMVLKNGFIKIIKVDLESMLDDDTKSINIIGTIVDITHKLETQKKLDEFYSLIDKYVIASSTDLDGIITQASSAFCEISGYTQNELIGQNHNIIRHEDMPKEMFERMWGKITHGEIWQGDIKNKKKDGGYYWVDTKIAPIYGLTGQKIGYSSVRTDITDKKIIEKMSVTDSLTDLYNRRFFNEVFSKELSSAYRDKTLFGFFIADVDNFKKYNDTYGHQAGDTALTKIALVIKNTLSRPRDYPFRLGGEEFGGIINISDIQRSIDFIEKLKKDVLNLKMDHIQNTPSQLVSISIGLLIIDFGIVSAPLTTTKVYEMADELLYLAKEEGRNKVITKVVGA